MAKLAQIAVARPFDDVSAAALKALDCLRVAVTLFDSQERLSYCNTHYNFLFRSFPPHETLIGWSYEDLIRLEIAGGELAELATGNADTYVVQRRTQLTEGSYRPVDVPLADGRILELKARHTRDGGWIILWNDVTEARNLLARLEEAIELSSDAFAFWDRFDRLTLCNSAFAEMHDAQSAEALSGTSFEELVRRAVTRGKFQIDGHASNWIERRLEAHLAPAGALTVTTADGQSYLVRERATQEGGSATVFTDVTERARVESALNEQTRTLERTRRALQKSKTEMRRRTSYLADLTRQLDAAEAEADTAKTTLLRTMSHELKTPLNAILGFSELLRTASDRLSGGQVGEYAGLINAAGSNLLRLINQILDLTKISAGRFPLQRAPQSVRSAFQSAIDSCGARAAEKSISLNAENCAAELHVDADANALAAMIANLVENAVAFTQAGGVVTLSAVHDKDAVRLTVADNGPGVAAEDLARILEPFEQAGRGTTDHSHGAGLGLPLVKSLVELHGGSLALESVVGIGFRATIELPSA